MLGSRDVVQEEKDDQRMSNPCYIARKTLGQNGVSMEAFGELTGRARSQIYKREAGIIGIPGNSLALYNLILTYAGAGISGSDMLAAMEAVPADERSETSAVFALLDIAVDRGRFDLISEALGRDPSEKAAGVEEEDDMAGATVANMMRGMRNMLRGLERQAGKSPEKAARRFRDAARGMAGVLYDIEQGFKALEDAGVEASAAELGEVEADEESDGG